MFLNHIKPEQGFRIQDADKGYVPINYAGFFAKYRELPDTI